MTASASLHKRWALLFAVFFITLAAFATDVVDLREELCFIASPHNSLDSNISNGIISLVTVLPEPIITLCSAQKKSSVKISFLHFLSYRFRAPPSDHS
ncbi:MAG: hypothetical protein A3J94_12470 [Syntrophus sp. RIFOXYC2_FULL_54_9]|nr:MAG: hypothetical protein A3J94_12470 [Syntrophus sp. RIFOXYC2_FULL_54_9]